jgi:hypothetical protein
MIDIVSGQKDIADPFLKDIIEAIKWKYVSTSALFSLVSQHQRLRENQVFKRLFTEEMNNRFENSKIIIKRVELTNDRPRYSYKYSLKKDIPDPFIPNLISALLGIRLNRTR